LNRFCLPDSDGIKQALLAKIADGDLGKYMGDLATCWWVFLVLGGIAAVLGFVYLVLLRWFAKPLIYISFVLIFVLLVGGGFYVYFLASRYMEGDNTVKVMHGMGVLLWILAGLFALILCCCWSRIQLGTAIIEAASDFVANTPSILLVPFAFFFIVGAWVVFWVISAIFVYSVGEAT
jgi:solute carrier family 44 (choline transporter-like protein), member 2/4/5